jgi:hypothetical protein
VGSHKKRWLFTIEIRLRKIKEWVEKRWRLSALTFTCMRKKAHQHQAPAAEGPHGWGVGCGEVDIAIGISY